MIMQASLLHGKDCAFQRKEGLRNKINQHLQQGLPRPELAVILLGDDPASKIYVKNKRKACEEVGIISHAFDLPTETSESYLVDLINRLNQNYSISGILVQLPLPDHINTKRIIEKIHPCKDVDGFHPYNLGRLAQSNPLLRPCTPLGIIHLLNHYQLDIAGKNAVVIGASNIVGRPLALELLHANATVTICNRSTKNLQPFVEQAEILIVATGVIDVINTEWLRSHQVLVDVGIHRLDNGKIRGDVDFEKAQSKVAWLTPVPGGVGPMTIVSLLENTLMACVLAPQNTQRT